MNYFEAVKEMTKIAKSHRTDPEVGHVKADDLLCEFLRSAGYGDLADEFEKVERWYA